jgi:hypothetical protein
MSEVASNSATRIAVLLLAPLMATSAHAAIDEHAEFQAGVALYTDLEFEQALFRFQRVAADSALTDDEHAIAFLWIAMCYGGLSDNEGAQRALTDAKRLDPDAPLPQYAAPRIRELYAATPAPQPEPATPEPVDGPIASEPPSPTTTAQPVKGMPVGLIAAAATASVAAGLLVSGGVVGALAGLTLADANALSEDPTTYQKEVIERLDLATLEGGVAAGLGVVGVGAGVAAGALFLLSGDDGLRGDEGRGGDE